MFALMQIAKGILTLSTDTIIYHSLDFTLQFSYSFILDFKKLLQLWFKLRQIGPGVLGSFLYIGKQLFLSFKFDYLSFIFS